MSLPSPSSFTTHVALRRIATRALSLLLVAVFLALTVHPAAAYQTERMVLVIVDGLRYSEGLGDPMRTYVPEMAALAQQGTLVEPFQNDGYTYTARAVPAIWCGGWTPMVDFSDPDCGGTSNEHSTMPSLFEYYRKGLSRPASDCVYVLKYLCSWKGSFNADYGPSYWPAYYAVGSTDTEVWAQAQSVLAGRSPGFMLLYLADVDHAGHSGDWNAYVAAIATADHIVGDLWRALQADPAYAGKTTMIVTNDHGRHTTDFTGHGDSCAGCRRIELLAVGPDIKSGFVSTVSRSIPDIVPTIGGLLGFATPLVTGTVMEEILKPLTAVSDHEDGATAPSVALHVAPNPMSRGTEVRFTLLDPGPVWCHVLDLSGRVRATLLDRELPAGDEAVRWDGRGSDGEVLGAGLYLITVRTSRQVATRKVLLLP